MVKGMIDAEASSENPAALEASKKIVYAVPFTRLLIRNAFGVVVGTLK